MINDIHQFVFLHVAKTGGQSISSSFKKRFGSEGRFHTKMIDEDVNKLDRMLGLEAKSLAGEEKWSTYFTFAFVRNPWDRVVSVYEQMHTNNRRWQSRQWKSPGDKVRLLNLIVERLNIGVDEFTFERFILDIIRDRIFENYHWDKQTNALTDGAGNTIFDFVGRFERLQLDYDFACHRIGIPVNALPHTHKSERLNWESYYTPLTRKIVADFYAEDIELFRY